ncbi:MAG: Uma2 family endonuclease [Planctomycetes bacterium]|nr:Uma2 family endonuclease [Planctomycetota bacterium]
MSAITTPPAPIGTTAPPPNAGPRRWRVTRDEYYRLGELGFFDGKRVELIRGEVIEMSPINIAHANGVGFVTDALTVVFALGYFINVQQPFVVPGAAPGSEPQPDVSVIPGSRRSTSAHPTQAALLVEVADSTLFYDTTTKAELYAEAGVPEYWVLDLNSRQLHVFRDPQPLPLPTDLAATAYRTHAVLDPNDTVSPFAAPAATIRVADLLP